MPKLRPQNFPVTSKGMRMARRATARNRGQVATRRNAQLPEMDLQRTIDSTMPNLRDTNKNLGNTRSPQSSPPLTSTTNPQDILSGGFQTSFAANPIKGIGPNNKTPGASIGHNGDGGGQGGSKFGGIKSRKFRVGPLEHNGDGGGDGGDPNVGRGYTKPQGAKGQYSRLK